jgi:hypothetical protein
VIEREMEGELLLFNLSEGVLFEVNETGEMIWRLLDDMHTIKEIQDHVRKEYGNINRIDKDVLSFLKRLSELNLVETNSPL